MLTTDQLADSSRVWIYQSSRPFTDSELPEVRTYIKQFAEQWVSHNRALRSFAEVYHNLFIVLMVDESQAGASGCSIDSSVHFLQKLGAHYQVDLFDRMTFAYKEGATVKTAQRNTFKKLYTDRTIHDKTLVFDNLVSTKSDFEQAWVKPLSESWHKRMV